MSSYNITDYEVQDSKPVWLVLRNEDQTEGRGPVRIWKVAESDITAKRLGRRQDVQGTNCKVEEATALKIDGVWMVPGTIIPESKEDEEHREYLNKLSEAKRKAEAAGLSREDLDLLFAQKFKSAKA